MNFITSCVGCSDVPALEAMIENSEEIKYDEFKQAVDPDELEAMLHGMGYRMTGLQLEDDWHVRYHRSTYQGKPCVYMVHSAIEYVFQ